MSKRLSISLAKIPVEVVIFFFFFSIYCFTMAGQIQYGDEIEKYRVAQSIVDRGQFSFRPTAMRNNVGSGGQTYSIYELGQSIAEIPFYILGKWLNSFAPLPDVNALGNLLVGFLNPLVTALACVLVLNSGQLLGYTHRTSLALALIFGLATIAWPYAKGYTREPLLALFLLLSFYAILRFQKALDYRWLLVAGFSLGALVFSKLIQGTAIPIFLIYALVLIFQNEKQSPKQARRILWKMAQASAILLLPFILFMGLQGLYALARFGTIYSGIGGTRFNPVNLILYLLPQSKPLTALVGLTLSPAKSLFLYSPPALLFFVAWYKWLRTDAKIAWLFLALVGAAFGTALVRPDWDGGTWWGPRYLVQITAFMILPLGILESYQNLPRRALGLALGALFALGILVQVVGASGNARDYLDITSHWITLAGQLDFLRHGALDSLMVYLSPQGLPIQVNPLGLVLVIIATLMGVWIFRQIRHANMEHASSWRVGLVVAAIVLLIEFTAFIVWIVAPYPQVLTAQANTQFVAANSFFADGRLCEARAMYGIAIERGTIFQQQALARLGQLAPLPQGTAVDASDLLTQQEKTGSGYIQVDGTTTIIGNGALMASSANGEDVIARGHASPMTVLPNTRYEISGWIKTVNVYGAGFGSVTVSEDDGAYRHLRDTDIAIQDETRGWTRFHKTLTTLPTTRRLFVAAGLWKSFGSVWVDGLEIAQITQTNPALADPQPCN